MSDTRTSGRGTKNFTAHVRQQFCFAYTGKKKKKKKGGGTKRGAQIHNKVSYPISPVQTLQLFGATHHAPGATLTGPPAGGAMGAHISRSEFPPTLELLRSFLPAFP